MLLDELDLFNQRLDKISEYSKLSWIIGNYGLNTVHPVASCLNSIPSSLTEVQKKKFLEKACPGKEIVHNIHCPVFVLSLPKNEIDILAPPVTDCLECGSQRVSYHSCDI